MPYEICKIVQHVVENLHKNRINTRSIAFSPLQNQFKNQSLNFILYYVKLVRDNFIQKVTTRGINKYKCLTIYT
jgi:hypothetical protein